MKLFHFQYAGYGPGYSVVADTQENARENIISHLKIKADKEREDNKERAKNKDAYEQYQSSSALGEYQNFKDKPELHVVLEYAEGEVLETEVY